MPLNNYKKSVTCFFTRSLYVGGNGLASSVFLGCLGVLSTVIIDLGRPITLEGSGMLGSKVADDRTWSIGNTEDPNLLT